VDAGTSSHTILILDKHLHAFPWESLPSLSHLNTSRLPSLEALYSRLVAARDTKASSSDPGNIEGHFISRTTGHSILNPSGDLAHTQSVIQPLLQSLPETWTHQTTAPTEAQLSQALASTSLFLYFGHGSGSQYIRPRAIKKLAQCPTTWLMGCSSSAVTDNGGFEPSGMVLAYLLAGAPAVVGTLWDVTDRDCDRASVKAGELWGLWEAMVQEEKLGKGKGRKGDVEVARKEGSMKKRRGRRKETMGTGAEGAKAASDDGADSEKCSLVEAVTRSRDVCYLRYLNGAAFVVYGIPVYLVD